MKAFAISRSLFSFLPIASSFGARQPHAQAAHWALVIAAVYVGMRWAMIMASMRGWLCFGTPNAGGSWILRGVALIISIISIVHYLTLVIRTRKVKVDR